MQVSSVEKHFLSLQNVLTKKLDRLIRYILRLLKRKMKFQYTQLRMRNKDYYYFEIEVLRLPADFFFFL